MVWWTLRVWEKKTNKKFNNERLYFRKTEFQFSKIERFIYHHCLLNLNQMCFSFCIAFLGNTTVFSPWASVWCGEKSVGYGERVYEFGQVIKTPSYLFPFAWEFSWLATESPVALESFSPGKNRVWALRLPPPLREKQSRKAKGHIR